MDMEKDRVPVVDPFLIIHADRIADPFRIMDMVVPIGDPLPILGTFRIVDLFLILDTGRIVDPFLISDSVYIIDTPFIVDLFPFMVRRAPGAGGSKRLVAGPTKNINLSST
ncbi:GL16435 [Drosophila persimilis]|uniref:GL16435 n=1 Tax=Drosophila persimilis TaxID=7234 RepID=B4GWI3_DROPE|nr:GL16435 [Drosophila persimilis]